MKKVLKFQRACRLRLSFLWFFCEIRRVYNFCQYIILFDIYSFYLLKFVCYNSIQVYQNKDRTDAEYERSTFFDSQGWNH